MITSLAVRVGRVVQGEGGGVEVVPTSGCVTVGATQSVSMATGRLTAAATC